MSVAPLKPWQRRQGSATVTESLPPRPAIGGAIDYTPSSSSTAPIARTLPVVNASSISTSAPSGAVASTSAPTVGAAVTTTAPGASTATTPALASSTGLGTSYSSTYGGGYGSRYGTGMGYSSMGGMGYGGYGSSYGSYGSSYGGGMGMNRYGGRGGDAEFFGPTTDSLSKFNEILAFNSYLLDQIYNSSVNIYQRLKHIVMWLLELKQALQRAQHATSDAERRELRGKILKRMTVLGGLASLFLLWCVRSLQRRRKRQMIADWQKIFPRNSAL